MLSKLSHLQLHLDKCKSSVREFLISLFLLFIIIIILYNSVHSHSLMTTNSYWQILDPRVWLKSLMLRKWPQAQENKGMNSLQDGTTELQNYESKFVI